MNLMGPRDLTLPTMVTLLGPALTTLILDRIATAGHQGVKPSHGYVMQQLVEQEPTIGELAAALGMTQQGASKQVGDLEALGYVERVPSAQDQRIRTVRLTPAGQSLLADGRRIQADLETALTERIGSSDLEAAKRALVALLELTQLDRYIPTRTVPLPRV
jgi:DNA-binding MarR family transcriptional regulator